MYPCTKFQLVWRTSDVGTILPQKLYENFPGHRFKTHTLIFRHRLD